MEMCVKEIVQACGGTLLSGEGQTVVTSVETDSREIHPGGLFVPIVGQNTDAHDFIEQTFAKGAVAALTQRHTAGGSGKHCLIAVENTQDALQKVPRRAQCVVVQVPCEIAVGFSPFWKVLNGF